KWAGFARGDVNDDGFVDLADVWWLIANAGDAVTYPLYPADYNGDVDLSGAVDGADQTYLMNYVSGVGAAPQGDWRF
ncbi:MAG TPA: hypothetical protein VLB27_04170, partial [candidate division Zixibacteria bacterium]|nr:hypothetical protein [candidate division Zixibacteria bacterium]